MKWKCKDGRVIDITQMDTQHLRNTINMLRQKGVVTQNEWDDCARYAFSPMSGEYAAMAAEQELYNSHPWSGLAKMEAELAKR
jgi:hypothetical protein